MKPYGIYRDSGNKKLYAIRDDDICSIQEPKVVAVHEGVINEVHKKVTINLPLEFMKCKN